MKSRIKIDINLLICLAGIVFSLLVSGCGTTTGNALIASEAFNTSGNAIIESPYYAGFAFGRLAAPTTTVNEFKLCVKRARLYYTEIPTTDEASHDQEDDSDENEVTFSIGEVDLSSGAEVQWGQIPIEGSIHLERLRIRAEKDQTLCPNYPFAMKFNGKATSKSVRFNFIFEPPVQVASGETISLSLATFVANLRQSSDDNDLTNDNLKEKVEASQDKASKKKKD